MPLITIDAAWVLAGETQAVPAQRLSDFIQGVLSVVMPAASFLQPSTAPDVQTKQRRQRENSATTLTH